MRYMNVPSYNALTSKDKHIKVTRELCEVVNGVEVAMDGVSAGIAAETERAEGAEAALASDIEDLQAMEQIVIDGGEAQIAQGSDFTDADATKRAKMPTVGAILDRLNDGVYDVSARNGGATFESLSALLSSNNLSTLIPTSWRKGGMSIRFVLSSDNNSSQYVQCRLMHPLDNASTATADFANTANWQGIDDEPTAGSENLVKSGGVFEIIFDEFIVGNGSYSWTDKIHFIPNHKYRIYVLNKDVYGSGHQKLALYYKNNNDYTQIAGTATPSSPLADYYDFTAPSGAFDYRLYYTVQADEKAYLKIEDRTEVKDIDVEPTPGSNNPVQSGGVADDLANAAVVRLVGNGMTIVNKTFNLSPNAKYRLYLDSWEYTYSGLVFGMWAGDTEMFRYSNSAPTDTYRDIITPDGAYNYTIKLRAATGTNLKFYFVQIDKNVRMEGQTLKSDNTSLLNIKDMADSSDAYGATDAISPYYLYNILKTGLSEITMTAGGRIIIPNDAVVGDTLSLNIDTNANYNYCILNINSLSDFIISCGGATYTRYGAFINDENEIISLITNRKTSYMKKPEGATKLVISAVDTYPPSYTGYPIHNRILDIDSSSVKVVDANVTYAKINDSTIYNRVRIYQAIILTNSGRVIVEDTMNRDFSAPDAKVLVYNTAFSSIRMSNSLANVKKEEIVLLAYDTTIGFFDGILYQDYLRKTTDSANNTFVLGDNVMFKSYNNAIGVSWSSLIVRKSDRNTVTIGQQSFIVPSPYLVYRPSTNQVLNLGSVSQINLNDIILLAQRNNNLVDGELLPYYYASLKNRPSDDIHLNVYRKAMQQKLLKWTPKAEVVANEGTHPAGVEVTGVPYSSVKELRKFVGKDVSIHTFMTAVNNVHSLLYTEKVGASDSQSAYGIVYHGTNCISYFGSVCSSYNSAMLGIDKTIASWEFQLDNDFEVLPIQDERILEIGDCMREKSSSVAVSGHVIVVIKIERNEDNSIKYIWTAEQAAPIMVIQYTPQQLAFRRHSNNGTWSRYKKLYNNVNYTPSAFVLVDNEWLYRVGDCVFIDNIDSFAYYRCKNPNSDSEFTEANWVQINAFSSSNSYSAGDFVTNIVDGETNVYKKLDSNATARAFDQQEWEKQPCNEWASYPFTYNDDIVTFAGDRASFRTDDLVYINYNIGSYTSMQLFKGNTLIQTISLPVGSYQVDVSSYVSTAGKYSARLTDGTNYSKRTYFETIDASITVNESNDIVTVSYDGDKAFEYMFLTDIAGGFSQHPYITEEELKSGSIVMSKASIVSAYRSCPETESPELIEHIYARCVFKGDYGNVASDIVPIMSNIDTGNYAFVHPNEMKDLGELTGSVAIALDGELKGNSYVCRFMTEIANVSVSVLSTNNESIVWMDNLPATLVPGYIYQIEVVNGIGSVKHST